MKAQKPVGWLLKRQMKTLINWLNYWEEVRKEGEKVDDQMIDFALTQIDCVQLSLSALRAYLEKSKN
jgi:hypothetical protein